MPLQELLNLTQSQKKIGLSEERLRPILPAVRSYIAFWREYPDLFVDFMQTGGDPERKKNLNFYFYQRVFLRAAIRYKYVYMVFPRAYSKSFLSVLVLMVRCILYPGAKLFVTSGGKERNSSLLCVIVKQRKIIFLNCWNIRKFYCHNRFIFYTIGL